MAPGTSTFTHVAQQGPSEGVNPTLGRSINVFNISTGPPGTVARRIYRTKANGNTYFLVGQLDDNSDTDFIDNVPDSSLTTMPPAAPAEGRQVLITNIGTGSVGVLARRIWRTKEGGSQFFFLGQIDNNQPGMSFLDNVPDESLTVAAPLVSTAGGESHTISLSAGPTGTIARRIYRTESGGSIYRLLVEIPNNIDSSFYDNRPDSELGTTIEPSVATAGGSQTLVYNLQEGPSGTLARNIYRTTGFGSQPLFVAQVVGNSILSSFIDNVPDNRLQDPSPLENTAGGQNVLLIGIPTGPPGTIGRRIYRTKNGGIDYFLAGQIRNNDSDQSWEDDKLDSELSTLAPLHNDAGGEKIVLTQIPIGGPSITARRIYREDFHEGELPIFRFVAEIKDNTTQLFVDDRAERQLGDVAPEEGTIGVLEGDTSLTVASTSGWPSSGFVRINRDVHAYTSAINGVISGLTPALARNVRVGDAVDVGPHLLGVPSIGVGSIRFTISDNETVHIAALWEDLTSIGQYERREYPIHDDAWTQEQCLAAAKAQVEIFSQPIVSIRYSTYDPKSIAGLDVPINYPAPMDLTGSLRIQKVIRSEFGLEGVHPRCLVEASSIRLSFEDVFRQALGQ
jgi:hypothetical protein